MVDQIMADDLFYDTKEARSLFPCVCVWIIHKMTTTPERAQTERDILHNAVGFKTTREQREFKMSFR